VPDILPLATLSNYLYLSRIRGFDQTPRTGSLVAIDQTQEPVMLRAAARASAALLRPVLLIACLLLTAGCWNGDVSNVRLGNVSLGTQLIDLQQALEQDAISRAEYDAVKEKLIALYAICESEEDG
jgi:hypothetical protein